MSQDRSKSFVKTRARNKQEAAEDYTELVADLIDARGEARICDIAKFLGVSHVTALRTVQRLTEEGYFSTEPYRAIQLTTKGKKLASFCKRRHELLLEYLKSIGVPDEVAAADVEGMEHHVSRTTLECMQAHLAKIHV